MESQVRGGTRWRRFAVVMVPSVAATAAIGVALAQGALAASFSVSGQSFKVSADQLVGYDFIQYGSIDAGTDLKGNKTAHPVAVSGFSSATITNMCQSVVTPDVPIFGSVSLELRAGTNAKNPVKATNIYIDIAQLDAENAEFENIDIGVAAGDKSNKTGINPGDQANPYGFGQRSGKATFTGVEQTAWATTAGTFTLSNLSLKLHKGVKECY
ncbi:DUF6230 family protein [Streptomyces sp. NPDC127033]|uniref:DUF6230 family protein n=1 Tax=Streptomyces sp. NPDC127033 TaxID=3347110 RepID=UPI003657A8E0